MRRFVLALRWGTLSVSVLLLTTAAVGHTVVPDGQRSGLGKVLGLLAHDPTTRRAAILASLGLIATALIFFRVKRSATSET